MNKYFARLPQELKKIISLARQVSLQTGMPAYLVGGSVRDLILGGKNFDLDITVQGDGVIFARRLAEKLKVELIIHERFKTATLILPQDFKLDVATTRSEIYPLPAALPQISAGGLREDLARRDFTINTLAVKIDSGRKNEIIDLFGGQTDLAAGKIRILHALSFKDDPTRVLRALRFSCRFGFKIEPKTLALLKTAINQGYLAKVNPHRLRDELILLLKENDPFKPIKALSSLGALSCIFPKLKVDRATQILFKRLTLQMDWLAENFPLRRPLDRWLVYFAILLAPLNPAQIKQAINRLGLRKGEAKRLLAYYQGRSKLIGVLSKKELAPDKIFYLVEPLSYETIILLKATVKNKNLQKHIFDFFSIYNGMRICVGGDDLRILGVLPGPEYQKILAKVLAAKLKGQVNGRQTELALVKKLAAEK
jgi:tRNA nucleotidyltransferase (CCA-adding enzyme)